MRIAQDAADLQRSYELGIQHWAKAVFDRAHSDSGQAAVRLASDRILSCSLRTDRELLLASIEIATDLPKDVERLSRRILPPIPTGWVQTASDEQLARRNRSLTGAVTLTEPVDLDIANRHMPARNEDVPDTAMVAVVELVRQINDFALPLLSVLGRPQADDTDDHQSVPVAGAYA